MSNASKTESSGACASEEILLEGREFPAKVHEKLKTLLQAGNVEAFRQEAGEAYIISGYVVEGNKIGRTLGYPTANLGHADVSQVLPGQGVYIAMVEVENNWHEGMANIGIRPTIDAEHVTIEAHLFNFTRNIYGKKISIAFLSRIRDEMRFNSLSELKVQLDKDALTAKELLRNIRWS
jgi:riboflavin kinase / FMN adenylyltransferase